MFKNPPGKTAGRLIDTAGLKGLQIGGARVSAKHANFFVNLGDASASDVLRLIRLVREEVAKRFGIHLELEVELFGDWEADEVDDLAFMGEGN
jgi:UDP-N-acetylmuramate dehydrogenase